MKIILTVKKLELIKNFSSLASQGSLHSCVEIARQLFQEIFSKNIKQLLYSFPFYFKNDQGQLFWSGPKRPPTPLKFDPNDSTHMSFIFAATNIMCVIVGIAKSPNIDSIRQITTKIQVAPFQPRKAIIKVTIFQQKLCFS